MKKTVLIMIIAFLACTTANATNYVDWLGGSSNWCDSSNWTVPAYDPCQDNTTRILCSDNDPVVGSGCTTELYREIRVGYNEPNNSCQSTTLTVSGGTLRTHRSAEPTVGDCYINIGQEYDANGFLVMSSGQIQCDRMLVTRHGYGQADISGGKIYLDKLYMGYTSGHKTGVFNMTGGEILAYDSDSTQFITVGYNPGEVQTFNMSGNAYLDLNAITIGWKCPGVFNMYNGMIIADRYLRLSPSTLDGADGTFNMYDGTVYLYDYGLVVGWAGAGKAVMNMSGGSVYTDNLYVGYPGCDTAATLNISGGTIEVRGGDGGIVSMETAIDSVINITKSGEIVWDGADTTQLAGLDDYIDSGHIVAYSGSGRVLRTTDTLTADVTAYDPAPELGQIYVSYNLDQLSWTNPDGSSVGVSVYFGTDPNALSLLTSGTDITTASVSVDPNTMYYWRVDTTNPASTGVVWSFSTNTIGARNPVPSDGATDILKSQVLSWEMTGDYNSVNINIGTDSGNLPLVATQDFADTDYHYDALEYNKTYYWRVDGVSSGGDVTEGQVFSFATVEPQCQISADDGDFSGDCLVNFEDFAIMVSKWLQCGWDVAEACQ